MGLDNLAQSLRACDERNLDGACSQWCALSILSDQVERRTPHTYVVAYHCVMSVPLVSASSQSAAKSGIGCCSGRWNGACDNASLNVMDASSRRGTSRNTGENRVIARPETCPRSAFGTWRARVSVAMFRRPVTCRI